jgi:hypothetical protein
VTDLPDTLPDDDSLVAEASEDDELDPPRDRHGLAVNSAVFFIGAMLLVCIVLVLIANNHPPAGL